MEENEQESFIKISGLYKNWFLDYASYVILERAIPSINDGLKPVQRRIFHSMRELEDGRYNKVANIVGNTMKYHPHGDAAITDAMVQIGQKELFIDTQGNWGNILTGDSAAASRYIEARLTPFALEVIFNPKTTVWQKSYDGRNNEPVNFPVKFPLLLAQGVEGIAVGLSTKILPHNFIELIEASIAILKNKKYEIFPDFITGGSIDVSNYNKGKRGGKIRARAKIVQADKHTLTITELPFGSNTSQLIESILKANEKGKIKIKKIEDNTSDSVEINIQLGSDVSPEKSIDALYAFTDCEISISPNACVIDNEKPEFIDVHQILEANTKNTVELLKQELEISLDELQEQWHFASLERIFIENRIYRDIEEVETWEGVLKVIDEGLKPFTKELLRAVTEDDILRLTEIRIKRISKFDLDKAQQFLDSLNQKIAAVKNNLNNIIEYSIDYYKNLITKYGKGRERKTEIRHFESIDATKVAVANVKFYAHYEEGFVGTSLKKDTYLFDCSDLDDIIVFRKDGVMQVIKVENKTFVGKNIIHIAVWKKNDKRTIYNMIYRLGKVGPWYIKRFAVTSITRNTEYLLTNNTTSSEVFYFSANPNGEAETVSVLLRSIKRVKKLKWDIDFSEIVIKGRNSRGNLISKNPVKKIELKEIGISTLAPRKIWFDETVRRLNAEGRGTLLGSFKGEDKILTITPQGEIKLTSFELHNHYDDDLLVLEKWNPEIPINCLYFDGEKDKYYFKKFLAEDSLNPQVYFENNHPKSFIEWVSVANKAKITLHFSKEKGKTKEAEIIDTEEFISIKGIKAKGNQLTNYKVKSFHYEIIDDEIAEEPLEELPEEDNEEMGNDNQHATQGEINFDTDTTDES